MADESVAVAPLDPVNVSAPQPGQVPTTTSDVPNQIPQAQPQSGGGGAAPPQPPATAAATAPQPNQPPQPPQKHGLAAILAAVGDALAGGATRKEVNPQTGAIEEKGRSTGAKVGSAISTLLMGAAAGAAQHGPGSIGRSALAGGQVEQEAEDRRNQQRLQESQNVRETNDAQQRKMLAQASLAKSNQDMARGALAIKAEGRSMDEHEAAIANGLQSVASVPGAQKLAHFDSNDDINNHLEQVGPDLAKKYAVDMAKNEIRIVPNPSGGFDAYRLPKNWHDQTIGDGHTVHVMSYDADPKTGKVSPQMKEVPAPSTMTWGDQQEWESGQFKTLQSYNEAQTKQAKEQADTKKAAADTTEAYATAAKTNEETKQLKEQTSGTASRAQLVQDVVHGNIVPERYGYMLGKKEGQEFLSEVTAEAQKEGIPLDTSKLAAYPKVYEQFTSTKPGNAGYAINSGATGLKHLQELERLNTIGSRVPGTAASKAFNNQLDTVVPELIKFYNMPDTDKSVSALKSTLGGLTNRDAAIKQQAHALGQKLDEYGQQWKNAAPSPVYQAAMPNMTDDAKYARAHLDPEYAAKLFSLSQWKQANPNADDAMMKHVESEARQRNLEIVK